MKTSLKYGKSFWVNNILMTIVQLVILCMVAIIAVYMINTPLKSQELIDAELIESINVNISDIEVKTAEYSTNIPIKLVKYKKHIDNKYIYSLVTPRVQEVVLGNWVVMNFLESNNIVYYEGSDYLFFTENGDSYVMLSENTEKVIIEKLKKLQETSNNYVPTKIT